MKKFISEEMIQSVKRIFSRKCFVENKGKIIKGTAAVIVVVAAVTAFVSGGEDEDTLKEIEKINENGKNQEEVLEITEDEDVIVDISGEVQSPMVAQLPVGSRIDDAIKAAGGLTKNADISNVNRAQLLEDGQKIQIPSLTGTSSNGSASTGSEAGTGEVVTSITDNSKKVNINTATSEELRTLNGVGPATAEKIINHRNENGAFKKIEDIKDVNGIGDKTFEKLKDHICV